MGAAGFLAALAAAPPATLATRADCRQRPYRVEYTGSLSNSAVNRRRARSVLNWGTVREHPWVLLAFPQWSVFGSREGHRARPCGQGAAGGGAAVWASQRPIQNEPIFRLLLKVAVKRVHFCEFSKFFLGPPTSRTTGSHRDRSVALRQWAQSEALLSGGRSGILAAAVIPSRPLGYDQV